MALLVALQLYSVRDDVQKDLASALRQVKEMGYDGVEFAGLYGYSPDYIRGLLEGIGLVALSAHVPYREMMANPKGVLEDYAKIGCKFIAIPYLEPDYRPGKPGFSEIITNAKMLGQVAKDLGMTLLYHNHDFEFTKLDGEYALDILYKEVPASLLETELDTCWVNVGGENPADYVRKYSGRAPVVHLKDFYMGGKKPAHMYALIGIKDDHEDDEPSSFEFRPVGHGMQNIPSILDASVGAGAEWVVVEQDEPSGGLTRMESAKQSRDYLLSLGW